MNIPAIAFFNSKGRVGKTSLIYHLAWMYADLGLRVIVADLDPQANLTVASLDDERMEEVWPLHGDHPETISGYIRPLLKGTGNILDPHVEEVIEGTEFVRPNLSLFTSPVGLVVGDLFLGDFEEDFSEAWAKSAGGDEHAFRVMTAFRHIVQKAAQQYNANVILIDLGPNFSSINCAALIAADYIIIPLFPNLLSLQGLRNLGPVLRRWREGWQERLAKNPIADLPLPQGQMQPVGYIVSRQAIRLDRPMKAYGRWIAHMPEEYHKSVLGESGGDTLPIIEDPFCLALLQYYFNLITLAQEARKPMFHLKPADGAMGGYMQAVQEVYREYQKLAREIAKQIQIELPPWPS